MVHQHVRDNGHGFTIIWVNPMVKEFTFIFVLGSNGCLWPMQPCLIGGHQDGFANSVGRPSSDSVGLLIYDSMRQYPGH